MKKLFIVAMALGMLASCAQDEVLDLNQEVIGFGKAFVDNSTRAIDPSYGQNAVALTQFNVWGAVKGSNNGIETWVPVFANDNVEGTVGSSQIWNCTTKTQYWIPGADYVFSAVVNGGVDANFTLVNGVPTQVVFTSDDKTDLLYDTQTAKGAAVGSTNSPVNFAFNHMLAKAVVTVSNTTDTELTENGNYVQSGYFYKITNVKLLNARKKETCTFATKQWTNTGTTKAAVEFGDITNAAQDATSATAVNIEDKANKLTSHYERMIIPQTFATLTIQFDLALYMKNGNTEVLINNLPAQTKSATNVTLEAGNSYSFNLSVGVGQKIDFSVTSQPTWVGGGDVTVQ